MRSCAKVTAASQPKLVEALQMEKQERYQRLDAVVDEVPRSFPKAVSPAMMLLDKPRA